MQKKYMDTSTPEVLTECPNPACRTAINQHRSSSWDRIQTTCGRDACRQFLYRKNKAERLNTEREEVRTYIRRFCTEQLPLGLGTTILEVTALLMQDKEHGHIQAKKVIEAIEFKQCKHDKIATLEENAKAAKRRAERAEAYNRQLEELYRQRIRDLEETVNISQNVENLIHGIAQRQLERQQEE